MARLYLLPSLAPSLLDQVLAKLKRHLHRGPSQSSTSGTSPRFSFAQGQAVASMVSPQPL